MTPIGTRRVRVRSGLTLVEVLVSIAILGVISAAVVSSFGVLVTLNRAAQADNELVAASRGEIEDVRNWAAPAATFDTLTRAGVDARLGAGSTCMTSADLVVVEPGVVRIEFACTVDGASRPATFTFLVARESST